MVDTSVKINEMFEGTERDEQVRRVADAGFDGVGFRPWYDDDLPTVVDAAESRGLDVAYLSGGSPATEGPEFPLTDPERRERAVAELERLIDLAADVDCATVNVIPGRDSDRLDEATKRAAVVESLREIAPRAEEAGVLVGLEPLNVRVDHPGYYLTSSYEGYQIVNAIDSPNVKLLYDVYHQQITEGNVIQNLRTHVDDVGHVHVADVPGRHEPGTGELNYRRIFEALLDAGYDGYVECEFVPTGEPEAAMERVRSLL
jgi:hydroxypyruvate isomerase